METQGSSAVTTYLNYISRSNAEKAKLNAKAANAAKNLARTELEINELENEFKPPSSPVAPPQKSEFALTVARNAKNIERGAFGTSTVTQLPENTMTHTQAQEDIKGRFGSYPVNKRRPGGGRRRTHAKAKGHRKSRRHTRRRAVRRTRKH